VRVALPATPPIPYAAECHHKKRTESIRSEGDTGDESEALHCYCGAI